MRVEPLRDGAAAFDVTVLDVEAPARLVLFAEGHGHGHGHGQIERHGY